MDTKCDSSSSNRVRMEVDVPPKEQFARLMKQARDKGLVYRHPEDCICALARGFCPVHDASTTEDVKDGGATFSVHPFDKIREEMRRRGHKGAITVQTGRGKDSGKVTATCRGKVAHFVVKRGVVRPESPPESVDDDVERGSADDRNADAMDLLEEPKVSSPHETRSKKGPKASPKRAKTQCFPSGKPCYDSDHEHGPTKGEKAPKAEAIVPVQPSMEVIIFELEDPHSYRDSDGDFVSTHRTVGRFMFTSEELAAQALLGFFQNRNVLRQEYKAIDHGMPMSCDECDFARHSGGHKVLVPKSEEEYTPRPYVLAECMEIVENNKRTKIGGDPFVGHKFLKISRESCNPQKIE